MPTARTAALLTAAAMLLGCGMDTTAATVSAPAAMEPDLPVTVTDATGATVTIESVDRIVPVDGDLAEIVFALALGDRVLATDLSATSPPRAVAARTRPRPPSGPRPGSHRSRLTDPESAPPCTTGAHP